MLRTMFGSKVHRATVAQADLHYVGSITIDLDLMRAADILEGEQVVVVDVTNGARLTTYAIAGRRSSGIIGTNGAAALLVMPADPSLSCHSEASMSARPPDYAPRVVHVDRGNRIVGLGHHPAQPVPGAAHQCAGT
ncbi:aspartate 1-decarboxylase [Mycobacterium sp. 852014-52144_SCH5372336]|uniref:aspartate 1-decarboxylase n=1 Tax=Mycobacterium sp. 852014-52144_SCH5372336 TaxID=1834115 RepID=UPI000802392A|nr:aspartate 1-decarboxylase [Mycobacterium sp. 852014-52144_SCH5372336]OBB75957.1 aspartate 1-decarboxylase [Mycobacterium sp. 852014-52144_SCH5372336]